MAVRRGTARESSPAWIASSALMRTLDMCRAAASTHQGCQIAALIDRRQFWLLQAPRLLIRDTCRARGGT